MQCAGECGGEGEKNGRIMRRNKKWDRRRDFWRKRGDVRFELTTSVPQERRSRGALWDGARRRGERANAAREWREFARASSACLERPRNPSKWKTREFELSRLRRCGYKLRSRRNDSSFQLISQPVSEKARASKPVLCTGVRLECASASASASEGLSSSAVDRSWRDLSSSAVDRSWRDLSSSTVNCLWRSVVRDTVNSRSQVCIRMDPRQAAIRKTIMYFVTKPTVLTQCHPTPRVMTSFILVIGNSVTQEQGLLITSRVHEKHFGSTQNFNSAQEVHCVASEGGGIRRADIVALDKTNSKGFILDPTVRFEMSQTQPSEVNKEKQQIYEPTIPYFREKYQMEGAWEVHGLMIGARGTIPRSTVNTIKTFGIHDIIPKMITSTMKGHKNTPTTNPQYTTEFQKHSLFDSTLPCTNTSPSKTIEDIGRCKDIDSSEGGYYLAETSQLQYDPNLLTTEPVFNTGRPLLPPDDFGHKVIRPSYMPWPAVVRCEDHFTSMGLMQRRQRDDTSKLESHLLHMNCRHKIPKLNCVGSVRSEKSPVAGKNQELAGAHDSSRVNQSCYRLSVPEQYH
ncbi:hypothetical protein ANN_23612 [Periplaneta americana]|uniref:Uncharacterized protein n=1 Tax=Periplaneta americana TaxID=6978 RepID=A0ABQ8SLK3_PERAM|nr:hypothetical protein ANN_23612 [Periplaneta americana]